MTKITTDWIYKGKSKFWAKKRENELLKTFHNTARNVPAYADFLLKNQIKAKDVTSVAELQKVPPMRKKDYLRAYPLEDLCLNGTLDQRMVFTSTSGSTGEPFYFPRYKNLDKQSATYHKMFLDACGIHKNDSTLVIDCFGMGVWIGGLITYEAFSAIADSGYHISVITPGVNKKEIYEAIGNIGSKFNQIVLCGYPPFIKDVIDDAKENGIDWKKHSVKIVFAAEAFSEKFRDYIVEEAGIKDEYRDTMNIYGSADLGSMAIETPLCILMRKLALKDREIYGKIFDDATRLPTLAQYIPHYINFECVDGNIYCTGKSVLPLVRYEIGDRGCVFDFDKVVKIFADAGIDLLAEAKKVGIADTIAQLPFVYIYERADLSIKLYGAILYPEHVKIGLQQKDIREHVTGKFTMFTQNDKIQNEYLEVNVELKGNAKESAELKENIARSVYEALCEGSAEYSYLSQSIKDQIYPKIVLRAHEDPKHFPQGGKQKWVKK